MIVRMSLGFAECDRARLARNAAYDGRFYTGGKDRTGAAS